MWFEIRGFKGDVTEKLQGNHWHSRSEGAVHGWCECTYELKTSSVLWHKAEKPHSAIVQICNVTNKLWTIWTDSSCNTMKQMDTFFFSVEQVQCLMHYGTELNENVWWSLT